MKREYRYIITFALISIIVVSSVALVHVRQENMEKNEWFETLKVNEGLIKTENFSIDDPRLGSRLVGKIFIYDVGESLEVLIVAHAHVAPGDKNGIALAVYPELIISEVDSEYRDSIDPDKYIMILKGAEVMSFHLDLLNDGVGGDGTIVMRCEGSDQLEKGAGSIRFRFTANYTVEDLTVELPPW